MDCHGALPLAMTKYGLSLSLGQEWVATLALLARNDGILQVACNSVHLPPLHDERRRLCRNTKRGRLTHSSTPAITRMDIYERAFTHLLNCLVPYNRGKLHV